MPYHVENKFYQDHLFKYDLTDLYLKNLEFFVCVLQMGHKHCVF